MREFNEKDYTVIVEDFTKNIQYDGSQIQAHYTTEKYGKIGNSILIFRGGMKLSSREMIDLKDIIRESHLANILISADDALHFIIEEFDVQPPNIEIAYLRLRLLTQILIEELQKNSIFPSRNHTDIYVEDKKLNVGIATISPTSIKIHFGVNITDTGIPKHVKAIGLQQLGISEENLYDFALNISKNYIMEVRRIKEDCAKTRPA